MAPRAGLSPCWLFFLPRRIEIGGGSEEASLPAHRDDLSFESGSRVSSTKRAATGESALVLGFVVFCGDHADELGGDWRAFQHFHSLERLRLARTDGFLSFFCFSSCNAKEIPPPSAFRLLACCGLRALWLLACLLWAPRGFHRPFIRKSVAGGHFPSAFRKSATICARQAHGRFPFGWCPRKKTIARANSPFRTTRLTRFQAFQVWAS